MITILIVDDYEKVLLAYKILIEDEFKEEFKDVRVLTAKDEDAALEIIKAEPVIDVVITDLTMKSETGGIDVLNAAKKKDSLTVVIIVTAHDKKLNRIEAFEHGAFDCLSKANSNESETGISDDELVYKVRNAIYSRKAILEAIRSKSQLDFYKSYFDPLVYKEIENDRSVLIPQNKTITIVFWDIRGFSGLCGKLMAQPKLIAEFLKEYFEVASKVIYSKNGVLDKFIGDGIMALFGAFETGEESYKKNAIAAIDSAKLLKKEFKELYSRYLKIFQKATAAEINIGLGCGIHTGDVIIGNLGTSQREHFTAIGDAVNLAARIEKEAKAGEILFSASTQVREDGHYVSKQRTISGLKHMEGNFVVYELVESSNC